MAQLIQDDRTSKNGTGEGFSKHFLSYESFSGLHRLVCLKSMPVAGHSHFASYLALHLPEVAARIDYDDFGILHLEVGALELAMRDAIARRDWHTVIKYFTFVADMMEDAGAELLDALRVSYLGNLFYGEISINYAKARSLMPESLSKALEEVECHYKKRAS